MRNPPVDTAFQDATDRRSLLAEHLTSLDDVWRRLHRDGEAPAGLLRSAPADRRRRLVRDLIAAARREADTHERTRLARHGFDLLLLAAVLAVALLGVRAISKAGTVAIALHDLKAGDRLRSGDLHGADGLDLEDGKRRGPMLRLTLDVPQGGYIAAQDLERYEVIAQRDIAARSMVPLDAVRQEWRPYRKQRIARQDQVVGNRTTRRIGRGTAVRPDMVEAESVLVEQVVLVRWLPRFHVLTPSDIRLDLRLRQPGGLLSASEALGRYPLQELDAGSTLTRSDLSPGSLGPGELAGRQLLTLRVQPPGFRLVPRLPARVLLAASAGGSRSLLLKGVPILALDAGSSGPSVVAALTEGEVRSLLPFLPEAQIFLLQPPS